jgi:hypothetical protein
MRSFVSRSLVGLALTLAGTQSALAVVVFNYGFEQGPAGASIASLVDTGPNGLNGTTTALTYSNNVAPAGGSFSANTSGDFNFARVGDNALMHVQSFSLSLLFNPTGNHFGTNDNGGALVIKKNAESGGLINSFGLFHNDATGKVYGQISFGASGEQITSADSFRSGWHSATLSLTRDFSGSTDKLELFVDGSLQASAQGTWGPIFYAGNDLVIGAANYLADPVGPFRRNFNGLIDQVTLTDGPVDPVAIPTPGSYALMLTGLMLLGSAVRRRKQPAA